MISDSENSHTDSQRIRAMAIELDVHEPESVLGARSAAAIGIPEAAIRGLRIARRALDARRRGGRHWLRFIVHVDLDLDADFRSTALDQSLKSGRARRVEPPARFEIAEAQRHWRFRRIVVVGSGPAGLYAAWTLASNGVAVDLIDRGPNLRDRGRAVARFSSTRELDPERNLLYGEGGAGTYSDGKLYTRTQHALEAPILQTLIAAGASPEIAFDARAHVGTDRLHRILPVLRAQLEEMGVRFHFETRLESLTRNATGRVTAIQTSKGEMPCNAVMLAIGHSARDTLRSLAAEGLVIEAKPFQLGLRVEHPQSLIDRGRLGGDADIEELGHAYYSLVAKGSEQIPPVHSFCMCPGGQIVASVAQPGMLCTNGMSNSKHSSPFGNSGLVVTLGARECGEGAFAGIDFQEKIEALFFEAGGGDYHVPAQTVPDFLAGRESRRLPRSSYKLGLHASRIDRLLPLAVTEALRGAILRFDRTIPGYAGEQGLLVGVESRSSSPFRMPRDPETRIAQNSENVYPIGEGAGYAGGIMSAAIDGARSAWALLEHS
ncbi:MAG: NAD(P)/FAD-dependent oxidoreductase [Myxococcota bacterium]